MSQEHWHRRILEHRSALFATLTTVCISIGGLVEIIPMFTVGQGHDEVLPEPYTPLEVAGRDIYVREGCMTCHSQMVRPFRDETLRYQGDWSHAVEYSWDRPFLLGSRRIGPDLHRVGGKYSDDWHYRHMKDPRLTDGSIMPAYPWLLEWKIDPDDVKASVVALSRVGTPYTDEDIANVATDLQTQGQGIVGRLGEKGIDAAWDDEIVALIAYLQRLGTDVPKGPVAKAGEVSK
ncbi:MAG: cytochrome-c oxidase, cbb3-type subunit II [Myxococcota bacterium]